MEKLKAVFHVNEADRWSIALMNIANLLKDVGAAAVDIVVIANGGAIVAYGEAEKLELMGPLQDQGVHFQVCNNSLHMLCEKGVVCFKPEMLPFFVEVIPAGITALIKKQQEGYAYIKP
ncbi:MAG TPA: DsrE family protein [Dissulfurispiraceae bacterium]|nr:DsrE family protein [Dissulfurispiraceae bacterium]